MGKRGPQPTPTAILRSRGSRRGKRREEEPLPRRGEVAPPDWLNDRAVAYWHALLEQLEEMDVVREIDGHALAVHCDTWSAWRAAAEVVAKNGHSYETKDHKGNRVIKQRPESAQAKQLLPILRQQMAAFGMTPSDRVGMRIEGRKPRNDLEAFKRKQA